MGIMDKFKDLINPKDEYEDDDYYDDDETTDNDYYQPSSYEKTSKQSNLVNLNASLLSVVVVKPLIFDNTDVIADKLKNKNTIILNLEDTPEDQARRIVDFLSGVAYGIDGKIQLIARRTYIIAPHSVDINTDILKELSNLGYTL